ncbi:DNA adenine methylase [Pandoraea sp. XY-2]|uniref:DNA adenine methylase n=1 Tax=Pandoraea sp. XY-2 TaxID=2518599 RepID=UPI00101AEE8D|nr:DNA adenine methylase [Pandoraea sp. XY-2]QBC33947.1 adenine methyltransferase [Pandoraea sp. XY-2]
MGHKGKLLPILGEVLKAESAHANRIADPFCGSGAVSWFLAEKTSKSVISGDLQSFAVARAAAVVERTRTFDAGELITSWFASARSVVESIVMQFPNASRSVHPEFVDAEEIRAVVERSRSFCESIMPPVLAKMGGNFPMTLAYGGHYFSPLQAIELDALRNTIPDDEGVTQACVAALVDAASRCAAAPGHTAQPFQPTPTAAKFIIEAWNKDVWDTVKNAIFSIASVHAQVKGAAFKGDCIELINRLEPGDLVFADPPYSDVHYSRFYHVLETLARGSAVSVSGVGRYPPLADRPGSSFSRRGEAHRAAQALIDACSTKEVSLVLTFPLAKASNGLSTSDFVRFGTGKFSSIDVQEVSSTFSTLGGNGANRDGRQACTESIVCFRP